MSDNDTNTALDRALRLTTNVAIKKYFYPDTPAREVAAELKKLSASDKEELAELIRTELAVEADG